MSAHAHHSADIAAVELIVGLEIHVELATRSKVFSSAPNPAHHDFDGAATNSLIDPVVLALPGSLPVLNSAAVDMAVLVGLALNCRIAERTKWDRKSYFYPDLPKGYQISQYDLPLCFDGSFDLPALDAQGQPDPSRSPRRIGIIRAHLEEDAGKLLHEAPGGRPIDFSIADWNRAGAPLLEIVTQPDFRSADEVASFARSLRNVCRFLGVTEGIMQKGHMRFEPNINTRITFSDGTLVPTPIVEIKNLNSFRSLQRAVEFEHREQPGRYLADRRIMGRGTKRTMGWDDARGVTVPQREKEDADDYRYFPDPDLTPVVIDDAWKSRLQRLVPELPPARFRRYVSEYQLDPKEADALVEERGTCILYDRAVDELTTLGVDRSRAARVIANLVLQSGAKRANERSVEIHELGITPTHLAQLGKLREEGSINAQAADEIFAVLGDNPSRRSNAVPDLAQELGLLVVRDEGAWRTWCERAIAANPKPAEDVRAGKIAAVGRIVGDAMKLAAGKADAKTLREMILKMLAP